VSHRADDVLPERLPLALGHGDFVPSNILIAPRGAVSVIDPLPAGRVPVYEDLARLLVSGRLLARRRRRPGTKAPRLPERALLSAYFDSDPVPVPCLRVFLALATLDRWADMVSRQPAGFVSKRLRDLRLLGMHRYFVGELRGQLATLRDDAGWTRP
jgi:aminoglycoside phosphotransferase (APT) family kinase protein